MDVIVADNFPPIDRMIFGTDPDNV